MSGMEVHLDATIALLDAAPVSWKIIITGHETERKGTQKPYTVYNLYITDGASSWRMSKRYSEFLAFHDGLKVKFPTASWPMPPKKAFGNMAESFVERRSRLLQEFVTSVLATPSVLYTWDLVRFFSSYDGPTIEDLPEPDRMGWLSIKVSDQQGWTKCWCCLSARHLFCYKDMADKQPYELLNLKRFLITNPEKIALNYFILKANEPQSTYFIASESPSELKQWLSALQRYTARIAQLDKSVSQASSLSNRPSAIDGSTIGRSARNSVKKKKSVERMSSSAWKTVRNRKDEPLSSDSEGETEARRPRKTATDVDLVQFKVFVRQEAEAKTIDMLTKGRVFTLVPRKGAPARHHVWCSGSHQDIILTNILNISLDRIQWRLIGEDMVSDAVRSQLENHAAGNTIKAEHWLSVADIVGVSPGHVTEAFDRAQRKYGVGVPEHCFSVIGSTSTLDLEVESEEERDEWVQAFRFLVGKYEFGIDDLNLRKRQLQELPYDLKLYRKGLTSLNLSGNSLRVLDNMISQLTALQYLDVSENMLGHLPGDICKLSQLKSLDASNNLLVTLPPELGQIKGLQDLIVSRNFIISLPDEIGSLARLHNFEVSTNLLVGIPSSMTNLVLLESLNLHHNHLRELPGSIDKLLSLTSLDVSDNEIATLPPALLQLTLLQELSIGENPLINGSSRGPPDAVWSLPNVRRLGVGATGMTSLPLPSRQNKALFARTTKLDISQNEIESLPGPSIKAMPGLTHFFAYSNKLTSLPPETQSLRQLQYCYLANNALAKFPLELCHLVKLTIVDVSNNQLKSLPPMLAHLTNLEELMVHGNKISALPEQMRALTKLQVLTLDVDKMKYPPSGIATQGAAAVISYLRDTAEIAQQETAWRFLEQNLD